MLQVVEDTEEHHDIEETDLGGREAANVVNAIFGMRLEQIARDAEALEGGRVDGGYLRAAPLQFEGKPAVPGSDIERALAAQVGGNGKLREAVAQNIEALKAGNHASIGQLHAVVPAQAGQFLEFF